MVASGEPRPGAAAGPAAPLGAARDGGSPQHDGLLRGDLEVLAEELGRFVEHVANLAKIRAARQAVRMQRLVMLGVAGGVAAILVLALGLHGVGQLASGISGGLAAAFSGPAWVGQIVGGLVVLALVALAIAVAWNASGATIRRKLQRAIDGRHKAERPPFEEEEQREIAELKAALERTSDELQVLQKLREFTRKHPELALACAAAIGAAAAPYLARGAKASMPLLFKWVKQAAMPG